MILSEFQEAVGHGWCSDAGPCEARDHGGEIVTAVEAVFELGEVSGDVLGADGAIGPGEGGLDVAERGVRLLREHGIMYRSYNRLRLYNPLSYNVRNHHKILVVDGAVGFTGGVCIADEWAGNARYKEEWRDTHFRVEGPVVAQLQRAFAASWLRTDGEVLFGEKFYPALEPEGNMLAQSFHSSAEGPREATRGAFLAGNAVAWNRSFHVLRSLRCCDYPARLQRGLTSAQAEATHGWRLIRAVHLCRGRVGIVRKLCDDPVHCGRALQRWTPWNEGRNQ
jgi:hypothetical protein